MPGRACPFPASFDFCSLKGLMNLSDLLRSAGYDLPAGAPETVVSGVTLDSRKVVPGSVFVAVQGEAADGHRFIPDALRRGAAAVVGSQALSGLGVPYIQAADSRRALATLAAAFHGFPARRLTVIGVTGTDGKTTTANLIYHILLQAGLRAGMISTVNAVIGEQVLDTGFHVTTPDAPDVQRYLGMMAAAGLTHVVLEATSHGLAQGRVEACEFDIGVVTNITHEHLDYHGSYAAYRAAKARLFTGLAETGPKAAGNPRLAVLNRDDQSYAYLAEITPVRQVSYGLGPGADLTAGEIANHPGGLSFTVRGRDFTQPIHTRLVGEYNVLNCLAALAAAVTGLGLEAIQAAAGIAALPGVPGRMERIDLGQDFTAIVDFAHTPNALLRALQSARRLTTGRVITVFGSAGLRDRQKRRMMAETAVQEADFSIFTAEDPRSESLESILAEMAAGAESQGGAEGRDFLRIPDRGAAIQEGLRRAAPGDLVIVCGKGHEQSMCFGETEYLWDDRTALRAALSRQLGKPGPGMPYLPTQGELPG
jgi:UDP-N-acetylmuramoyl-L-alanyl-D-glutamate--2,6-diaminopimelate ligase